MDHPGRPSGTGTLADARYFFWANRSLVIVALALYRPESLGHHLPSLGCGGLKCLDDVNVDFREVAPGKGSLDYTTYLKRLAQLPRTRP